LQQNRHKAAVEGRAEHVRSARDAIGAEQHRQVEHTERCSAIANASDDMANANRLTIGIMALWPSKSAASSASASRPRLQPTKARGKKLGGKRSNALSAQDQRQP